MSLSPSSSLQVIALISGGKDSFLSLFHCLAQGHTVVALANLHPPPSSLDPDIDASDLNSHMYQSAGHALVPFYADALSIPLYRAPTSGIAASKEREYAFDPAGAESEEETEDLVPLLRRIMHDYPQANALSSGAILSTYQRTRVESVCSRLGLVSLAFLWQYPFICSSENPVALLEDGARVGLDARIVKVASGGLDDSFLWESLAEEMVRKRVKKAVGRFGGSVLGEGGEYETLVVGGPPPVWRGRIEVGEGDSEVRRGEGGEAWMEFRGGKVVKSEADGGDKDMDWMKRLKVPWLWDSRFEALLDEPLALEDLPTQEALLGSVAQPWEPTLHFVDHGETFSISNLSSVQGSSVEDQMASINAALSTTLKDHNTHSSDIIFTTIVLRSMSDFSIINSIYSQLFTRPNPPARVTIACGKHIPQGKDILLSAIVHKKPRAKRKGLHVQSRSYWAPANIGPYSQAISVDAGLAEDEDPSHIVHIAGQIPLVPASMDVFAGEPYETREMVFRKQALLALQHLWRIGTEMDVGWWGGAVAFLAGNAISDPSILPESVCIAWELWMRLHKNPRHDDHVGDNVEEEHEDTDGPDIWDLKYGGMGTFASEDIPKKPLPDWEILSSQSFMPAGEFPPDYDRYAVPGFFAVEVAELPRACDIEWQATGYSHGFELSMFEGRANGNGPERVDRDFSLRMEDILTGWSIKSSTLSRKISGQSPQLALTPPNGGSIVFTSSEPSSTTTTFVTIPLKSFPSLEGPASELLGSDQHDTVKDFNDALAYFLQGIFQYSYLKPAVTVYTPYPTLFSQHPMQVVPCARVWGIEEGKLVEAGAGLMIRSFKNSYYHTLPPP